MLIYATVLEVHNFTYSFQACNCLYPYNIGDAMDSGLRKRWSALLLSFLPALFLVFGLVVFGRLSLLYAAALLFALVIPIPCVVVYLQSNKDYGRPAEHLSTSPFDKTNHAHFSSQYKEEFSDYLHTILNNSPMVAFIWQNAEGWPVEYVTRNIRTEFGYDPSAFFSGEIRFDQIVHTDDLARVINEVKTYSADMDRESFTHQPYRIVTAAGDIRWVDDRSYIVRNNRGDITHYCGVLTDITEQVTTNGMLQRNANFTNTLLNAVPTPVFYKDAEGLYQGCNSAFTELMGVTEADIVGKRVEQVWPSTQAEVYRRKDLDLMRSPRHQIYEFEIKDKEGKTREVVYVKDVFRDEEGKVAGIVGAFLDISEIKATHRSLAETNRILKVVLDTIPVRVFWKNLDSVYLGCNQPFADDAGVASADDIVGRSDFDFVFSEQAEKYRKDDSDVINSGKGRLLFEEFQNRPDGTRSCVLTSKVPLFDDEENVTGLLGAYLDITDRKEMEEDLRKLRNYLTNIIDSMPSVLVAVDKGLNITQWNSTAEQISGLKAEDIVDQPLERAGEFFTADIDKIKESLETKAIIRDRARVVGDGRDARVYDLTIFPLSESSVEGAVIRFDDVTDNYKLQEQLNHRSKMDAIGQLAGGVAHDFNNLLGGIIGATELLRFHLSEDAKLGAMLSTILEASERAAELTQKLLTFARKQHSASTVVDLNEILEDTIGLLEKSLDKRINIVFDKGTSQAKIVGDPSQLQSVFMNMGINAAHAMPDGGTFAIATEAIRLDELYCRTSSFDLDAGDYLQIKVKDTGCGIAAEVLPHIFEPFFTTKKQGEGTGLGLATAFGTIQQHRGAITVYSEPGIGTIFHLLLPLTEQDALVEQPASTVRYGAGTILLVDDEDIVRTTAKMQLEILGYNIVDAANGSEAVAHYREKWQQIDLVLLDMIMPVMNGKDCFAELKKINPDVRVILSSGYSREEDIASLKEQGLLGVIHKPYRVEDLSNEVAGALNS